jgi:drug/metabolite transporter (DMT)-like permease
MTAPVATTARPRIVYLYLAIIVVSWAGNWPLMKLALADAPPLSFVLLRLVGTIALIAPVLLVLRAPLVPVAGERLGLLVAGQLQIALWLIFGIIGLAIVPAGRAIVLAFTMPLWAIAFEMWLGRGRVGRERLGRFQLAGAAVGFAGLLLFLNPGLVDWRDWRVVGGNAMLLLAAISWAWGSILYRRRVWRSTFWAQTFWQLAVSTVTVAIVALPGALGEPIHWSPGLLAILAYNWIVTTALGYFLWNKILAVMPAAVAGQVMALTPIIGFLLSAAVFGGAVTAEIVVSIVLIVAGIILTLRR